MNIQSNVWLLVLVQVENLAPIVVVCQKHTEAKGGRRYSHIGGIVQGQPRVSLLELKPNEEKGCLRTHLRDLWNPPLPQVRHSIR